MRFKSFLETTRLLDKQITDRWPVNKAMYDLSSEEGKKDYEDALRDYFSLHQKLNQRKLVSEQQVSEPYTITCWRGCDSRSLERDTVEEGSGYRVLHGKNAMEGILWFTHSLQAGDLQAKEYAQHHAKDFLITYPLDSTSHFVVKKYDNGDVEYEVPPDMTKKYSMSESRNILRVGGKLYEIPEGWFFTWQVQKHLGCFKPLKIMDSMIERAS